MNDLESQFGRSRFSALNKKLNVFVTEDDWSKIERRTKPYRLTHRVSDLREEFFSRRNTEPTQLLAENGDVRHVAPDNALVSKRKNENGVETTRKSWLNKSVLSAVPVNQYELQKLADHIQSELIAYANGERTAMQVDPVHATHVRTDIRSILHHSNNNVAPGCVIHKYDESLSGRMYAKDVNLQTIQRQVRYASLHGLWDYDIENCHYSILQQMATQVGYKCQAINHYLNNKSQVRCEVAKWLGVTEAQVKKVLLSMVYGATMSRDAGDAIPSALGKVDNALAFYKHSFIRDLFKDIRSSTKAILAQTKTPRDKISNFRKLPVSVVGKKPRQLLAHLLQGVEAAALEAAHDVSPGEIVLLQHDGFTATSPNLSIEKIEASIFKATGYHLKVARSGPLQANPSAALINLDKISATSQIGPATVQFKP
jgi:hypothetical protein